MKNKKVWAILTFISMLVGFMISIQFYSTRETTRMDTRDISDLRSQLSKELERKNTLLTDISAKRALLNQYKQNEKQQEVIQIMVDEFNKTAILAGLVPVNGKGAVITIHPFIQSTPDYDQQIDSIVVDDDLRTLVNELFANGAQAISINGKRLISTSAIRNVGYQIQINNQFIHLPYEIKVIGDANVLKAGVQLAGLFEYFQLLNKEMIFEEKENIDIPSYNGDVTIRHMKPVKAGEQ